MTDKLKNKCDFLTPTQRKFFEDAAQARLDAYAAGFKCGASAAEHHLSSNDSLDTLDPDSLWSETANNQCTTIFQKLEYMNGVKAGIKMVKTSRNYATR